ncbi:hypothetical protein acdb102_46990 [Acidothermaceae bacterium B102]|nr:hypothetical protein acdb102_46990 [Acidothermaceae bacterium B102]
MAARVRSRFPTAVTAIDNTHLALLTTRSHNGEYVSGWTLDEVELPAGRVTRSVEGPDDSPAALAVTPTSIYLTVSLTATPSAARDRLIRIRRSDFSMACRTPDSESGLIDPTFLVAAGSVVWTTQYNGSLLRFADGGCTSTSVPLDIPPRASGPYGLASNGRQLVMSTSWPTSDTLPATDSPWEGEVEILDGSDGHRESTVHLTAAHLYAGTRAVGLNGNDVFAADENPHQIHVISGADVTTFPGAPRLAALPDGVSLAADTQGCIAFHGSNPGPCPDFLRGEAVIGSGGGVAILASDTVGETPELLVVRVART